MKKYIKNLNIMKAKVIILTALCAVLLWGCPPDDRCIPPKKPANLKPIDCEHFNDVATVYWNLESDCKSFADILPIPCDTVLVEGWGYGRGDRIILCVDSVSAAKHLTNGVALQWAGISDIVDYYYIVCDRGFTYRPWGSPGHYSIELIGYRIIEWNKIQAIKNRR